MEDADESGFLCSHCREELLYPAHACSQCAEPITQPGRCARCQKQPPAFDYGHSSYLYKAPVSGWLLAAKDKSHLQWLTRLSWLMLQRPPAAMALVEGIVIVPASRKRLLFRGYNPAEILARRIAEHYQLPLYDRALIKRSGIDQRRLSARQRLSNQKKNFSAGKIEFNGEHLLIIDDVITTGATADAVATVLKSEGAGIVGVWSLCRTPVKSAEHKS